MRGDFRDVDLFGARIPGGDDDHHPGAHQTVDLDA